MTHPQALPELAHKGLKLRAPLRGDIDTRRALGRPSDGLETFGIHLGETTPLSQAEAEGWYDALLAQPMGWVIEYQGAMIGDAYLHAHVPADRRASLAVELFDAGKMGQGIGPQAMHLLLDYAFETMRLHRISVGVLASNTRAIVAYRKVGFVEEGRARQSARAAKGWEDEVMMGLLRAEYVGHAG